MKYFFMCAVSIVWSGLCVAVGPTEIKSPDLVISLMRVTERVKILSGDCEICIFASTGSDNFATITMKSPTASVTLGLTKSSDKLTKEVSTSTEYEITTYKSEAAEMVIRTLDEVADTDISLKVADQQINCQFKE